MARRNAKTKAASFAGLSEAELTRTLKALHAAGVPGGKVEIAQGNRRVTVSLANGTGHIDTSSGYLPLREACAYGHFGRSRAYELINAGLLKMKKIGGKTLIKKASIDRMLAKAPKQISKR